MRNLANYCSIDILKMAYYGLIYPHLTYGIRLWGSCAKFKFERVFRLQKKAIRVIAKLKPRDMCRDAFRQLNLLTLPCLYMLDVILYCRFHCDLVQGSDIHNYDTRSRNIYRTSQHRTTSFEQIPSQAGVRLINMLPRCIKDSPEPKKFKFKLKSFLISNVFYSVDEFTSCRWV